MILEHTSDRRRAARLARSGRLEITFEDPLPATVEAELVEISKTGFRAAHACGTIVPGLEVQYRREDESGRARVMWTHMLEGKRVSGFLVL